MGRPGEGGRAAAAEQRRGRRDTISEPPSPAPLGSLWVPLGPFRPRAPCHLLGSVWAAIGPRRGGCWKGVAARNGHLQLTGRPGRDHPGSAVAGKPSRSPKHRQLASTGCPIKPKKPAGEAGAVAVCGLKGSPVASVQAIMPYNAHRSGWRSKMLFGLSLCCDLKGSPRTSVAAYRGIRIYGTLIPVSLRAAKRHQPTPSLPLRTPSRKRPRQCSEADARRGDAMGTHGGGPVAHLIRSPRRH
jgi:hypothetical protein